ncbi:MAG: sigma-54 dependent transcriptional regulator [Bacteroidales bacterium]|nr:sigma-54 dependent transcriptional regulator [Bacteroidales bacterium]
MKLPKILVIDDEKLIRWSFEKQLNSKGYKVFTAETGEEGIKLFEKHYPDVVFVDNRLPGIQGLEVISKIKAIDEDATVVFMTAYGSIDTAVQAMKEGAAEYVNKPFSFEEINLIIENIKNNLCIANKVLLSRREQREDITFDLIVGQSQAFKKIINISKKIARSETTTILLLGETGTGKDLFARAIHNESNRKDSAFVTINCSTFPDTLLESEIFGHEKGAFTDAKNLKKGLFEIAEGGTVFLDEVGEINLTTQVKLLSVLENRVIKRLGGTVEIPVDIRIIAATNKELKRSVEQKTFREDLYYRLKVFQIDLPPLREHIDDVPLLIDYFISQFNEHFHKNITGMNHLAEELMIHYHWPGNIRELRNVMEHAVILENSDEIQVDSLPGDITKALIKQEKPNGAYQFVLPDEGISLDEMEKQMILQALEKTNQNQSKACKLLGISRDTLRYKKKKYNI